MQDICMDNTYNEVCDVANCTSLRIRADTNER